MPSQWIIETSDETFEQDVVVRSETTPVLLDFWASWCARCRMLGPILEAVVDERGGAIVLVKADTDKCQTAAAAFQVSSIPAVYLVYQGKIVDNFAGVLPEAELKEWLDQHQDSFQLMNAEALESSAPAEAEKIYREAIAKHPNQFSAMIGLARVLAASERTEEAAQWIESLEKRGFLEPEAEKIKAQIELSTLDPADIDGLRAEAAQEPDDLGRQLALAKGLMSQQAYPEALELCLKVIEQDRQGAGEEAKHLMLDVFRVWNDEDQVRDFRRRLSMLLY